VVLFHDAAIEEEADRGAFCIFDREHGAGGMELVMEGYRERGVDVKAEGAVDGVGFFAF
jgi:hypothetical protein